MGSRGRAPRVLIFGTKWDDWPASRIRHFTVCTQLNWTLGGPQSQSGRFGKDINLFPLTGIEPHFLGLPMFSLSFHKLLYPKHIRRRKERGTRGGSVGLFLLGGRGQRKNIIVLEGSQASPTGRSGVSGVEVKKTDWYEAVAWYKSWGVLIYLLILKFTHWKENWLVCSENGLSLMDLNRRGCVRR